MESTFHSNVCKVSETVCNGEVKPETGHTMPETNDSLYPRPQDFGLDQYEGFWYHTFHLKGVKLAQNQFQAQASDIFLCSVPKSGTTWLKALAFTIVTRTHYDLSTTNPLLHTMPHDCIPLLEVDVVQNLARQDPDSPLLSTHIPYPSLPKSIIKSDCKIVYICREPKDAFVSFWHFIRKVRPEIGSTLPLEIVFDLFCRGISYYGPYWDHILGFWKANLERPGKVLFLKYEDMKRETSVNVKQLAEFLGHPFSEEEESQGVVEMIIRMCSFERLSNMEVNKVGRHRPDTPVAIQNNAYFRKGKIGDWRNCLTPEMRRRMDQITEQKLGPAGLTFPASVEP